MGVVDVQQRIIHDPNLDADLPAAPDTPSENGGDDRYRTILEIWSEILSNVDLERTRRVTAAWASRIVSAYPEITFASMNGFRNTFYEKVQILREILLDNIATDDECLKRASAEEDEALNGGLYRNLLVDWQKRFLQWELAWDCESGWAATELACLAEVHKMFFDETGMIGLLDQIGLQFTDEDREALANELLMMKEAADGHR